MVVAEEVEEPVDQEPVGRASRRLATLRRLAPGTIDRDHDVAEEPVGRAARTLALREREHIGRAVAAAPAPVEGAHLAVGDEDDGELGPVEPEVAQEVPRLLVFNKIDRGGDEAALRARYPGCIVMSAKSEDDIARLREAIGAFFQRSLVEAELFLPWSAQNLRGQIFATCTVLEERAGDTGAILRVRGEPEAVARLREQFGRR